MRLEIRPPVTESQRAALVHAFARAGVRIDGKPQAYASAWLHAAVREAVDNQPSLGRYAPSPRSTRGATRA